MLLVQALNVGGDVVIVVSYDGKLITKKDTLREVKRNLR